MKNYQHSFYLMFLVCILGLNLKSQDVSYYFPADSAIWTFEIVNVQNPANNTWLQYSSFGDTIIGGISFHKIYYRSSSDSSGLSNQQQELKLLVLDSNKSSLYITYLDSGMANPVWYNPMGEIDSNKFYFPYRTDKGHTELEFEYYWNPIPVGFCSSRDGKLPLPFAAFRGAGQENIHPGRSCDYRNLLFFSYIGERESGWFGVDMDSALFNVADTCSNKPIIKLRSFDWYIRIDVGPFIWVRSDIDCLDLTGVKQNQIKLRTIVYPNPVKKGNSIHMAYPEGIKSVSIFDIHGRAVITKTFSGFVEEIEVSSNKLQQGLYFVSVNNSTGYKLLVE